MNVLTHCNAGWLATVDWGTALAPIYTAHERGIDLHVWVDETRPRNQGAALTAWELGKHGVPHTVIADNAGGHLMQHGEVDLAIVGTDRVTRTRRCRQQDRHLPEGAGGARQRRAVLGGAALVHDRLDGVATASREIPIEERAGSRGDRRDRPHARTARSRRCGWRRRQRRRQPGLRRDAGAAGDRADHRARPLRCERGGTALAVSRTRLTLGHPMRKAVLGLLLAAAALSACADPRPQRRQGAWVSPPSRATCLAQVDDGQEPPFLRDCFGNFDRASAVAIADDEWRAWGQPVYDADPHDQGPVDPDKKAERQPGSWQRVGLYWWIGMNESNRSAGWTGKHDAAGMIFSPGIDGNFAWSAAFVSFVMRMAGAGAAFPYAESHSDYIDAAVAQTLNQTSQYAIQAEPPDAYAPEIGDIICTGRGRAERLTLCRSPGRAFSRALRHRGRESARPDRHHRRQCGG